ncbi:hypothetical protein [Natrinema salsiterrestre]|uniref:Uncharacterized protein n=1 Tax=Natrinema salsiterrestre TaxID=2950540 RepID=A0A9Q4Q5R7_9EURY|nr:hypothetical protein [Natrinema salsiterrestre]MDF9748428.1 hypothetical protein [Natrinema salsiterrestre]
MDLNVGGRMYGITTGGYASAIPTDAIHQLEEATHYTRTYRGGFPAEELDLAAIFTTGICLEEPIFTVQFGRAGPSDDRPTYQAVGKGVDSLQHAEDNISKLSQEIEEEFDESSEFSTHRPLIRAHTDLQDGSVLYAESYYHTHNAESVKRFELVVFHPDIPFNADRYDEIHEVSPARPPSYIEEGNISTGSGFGVINYEPQNVKETAGIESDVTDKVSVDNPIREHSRSIERPWNAFESPNRLYAESYLYDNMDEALITALRAASPEIIEPVFYRMEVS